MKTIENILKDKPTYDIGNGEKFYHIDNVKIFIQEYADEQLNELINFLQNEKTEMSKLLKDENKITMVNNGFMLGLEFSIGKAMVMKNNLQKDNQQI